jgi:hypothetical protein
MRSVRRAGRARADLCDRRRRDLHFRKRTRLRSSARAALQISCTVSVGRPCSYRSRRWLRSENRSRTHVRGRILSGVSRPSLRLHLPIGRLISGAPEERGFDALLLRIGVSADQLFFGKGESDVSIRCKVTARAGDLETAAVTPPIESETPALSTTHSFLTVCPTSFFLAARQLQHRHNSGAIESSHRDRPSPKMASAGFFGNLAQSGRIDRVGRHAAAAIVVQTSWPTDAPNWRLGTESERLPK